MSAELSDFAICRIQKLLNGTDSHPFYDQGAESASEVNRRWSLIYRLYLGIEPALPLDYLRSAEFALTLKGCDAKAVFAHGRSLAFKECPVILAAKLVEGFLRLQDDPLFLDVTAIVSCFGPCLRPMDVWPDVYDGYLPCYAGTTTNQRRNSKSYLRDRIVTMVVEKFHIRSKNFSKLLTVELHFRLTDGCRETDRLPLPDAASDLKKPSWLKKVAIYLDDVLCPAQGGSGFTRAAARPPTAIVRIPDLNSDVYGFLDRVHIGTSLVANRSLHESIISLAHHLPVHHLMCEFERDTYGSGCRSYWNGFYWFKLTHMQRDLSYDDERLFKMPSCSSTDSALIRRYLSSSHVARLLMPTDRVDSFRSNEVTDEALRGEYRFAIRMLADAANRNVSVGYLRLFAGDDHLTDYRSMDVVLGEMRIRVIDLRATEDRFMGLIKTTDFFRLPTIQGLKELKLDLWTPSEKQPNARNHYPLWTAGITQLSECSYYEVDYHTHPSIARRIDRRLLLQSIARRIVTICMKFERGEITAIVEHFALRMNKPSCVTYSFGSENIIASGLKISYEDRGMLRDLCWDVYRFRNAATGEWLTACVGQKPSEADCSTVFLHILKGEALPNASFAYFRNALI